MELTSILAQFLPQPEQYQTVPVSNGHINHTYIISSEEGKRYILQKINTAVFTQPQNIAHNHQEVNRILEQSGYQKSLLKPHLSLAGNYLDETEQSWRMLEFIEGSNTHLKVPDPETAYNAAVALSEFYAAINRDNIAEIKDPLPGFINFEKRIADYRIALDNAAEEYKTNAAEEIKFVNENLELPKVWIDLAKEGKLPQRIIHADPKISNLLFDDQNQVLAVIDLDTIMYGTLLYDFGDMIRSYTNTTEEDDGKTAHNFSAEIYQQVQKGFNTHLQDVLTDEELSLMDYAAKVVIYIQAVRFLTDYLNGSVYYSVKYADHNLDRTRNQITLLKGLTDYLATTS